MSDGQTLTMRVLSAIPAVMLAVVVALGALFAAGLSPASDRLVSEIGSAVVVIALLVSLLIARGRSRDLDRLGWTLFLAPIVVAGVAYGIDPVDVEQTDTLPLAFLVGPLISVAHIGAVMILARGVVQALGLRRVLLDALWLGIGVAFISWSLVAGPAFDADGLTMSTTWALVVQSLLGAFMVGLVIVLFQGAHRDQWSAMLVRSYPALCVALSQSALANDFLAGTLDHGTPGDLLSTSSIGYAAAVVAASARHDPPIGRRVLGDIGQMLVTWLPVVAWLGFALFGQMSLLPENAWLTGAVMAVAVVRLSMLVVDNGRLARTLHHRTTHDHLTGLPNRDALDEWSRMVRPVGVHFLLIDLDRFKAINDTLGLKAGDDLLRLVAQRISHAAGDDWTVFRIAGDEFAAVSTMRLGEDAVRAAGERITERLGLAFYLEGREVWLGSAVSAVSTDEPLTATELLDATGLALRDAAGAARGGVVMAGPELLRRASDREDMEIALRTAVEKGELFPLFQPKVDLQSGAMVGVEALVRWNRPGHGIVPPGEFIAVAEASGLIAKLDTWMMAEAVGHLARWNQLRRRGARLGLSTNMSAWQLARVDVDDEVRRAIAWEGGVDPAQLTIELTETMLIEDPAVVARRLDRLRSTGVGVSVDDFGAGFTSVAYLRKFPISEVKIDRDLVWELTGTPEDSASMAAAVIALARAMHLDVVAEGIETAEQAGALRRLGCRTGQGFLFAKPLSVAEIDELVTQELPFADLVRASSVEQPQM